MARNPTGKNYLINLDYDYVRYPPVESRFSPNIDMQELNRSMSQPLPPGMNQYRPRYPQPMRPTPERPAMYFEGQVRYPTPGPRANYRPGPEFVPNYNPNFQNPQMYPPMRPQSPVLYHLDPGAMPYIPAKYIPPSTGTVRNEVPRPRAMVDPNMRPMPMGIPKSYSNPPINPQMNMPMNPSMNPSMNPAMNPGMNPTMNPSMNQIGRAHV